MNLVIFRVHCGSSSRFDLHPEIMRLIDPRNVCPAGGEGMYCNNFSIEVTRWPLCRMQDYISALSRIPHWHWPVAISQSKSIPSWNIVPLVFDEPT